MYARSNKRYAGKNRPYMGAVMGHTRIFYMGGTHESHGSSNGACMGAYIGHMGAANGACIGAYMAIYGSSEWGMYARIYRPYMGTAMGHVCAHI